MVNSFDDKAMDKGNEQLNAYPRQPFIDIHCHCLPGIDDGPGTMMESLELCRRLAEEGITKVVATPHQLGRFNGHYDASKIREAVCNLNELLKDNDVPLEVVPGSEVRLDERIHRLLDDDKILTLADGGKYLLLELPFDIFIDIEPLLIDFASMGIQCIIAHTELNPPLVERPQVLFRWLEHAVHLQITASSIVGDFGPEAQRNAWALLTSHRATLVATDSHNVNFRRPRMRAAFTRISEKLGQYIADLACIKNPSRVVKGEDIKPVNLMNQQEAER